LTCGLSFARTASWSRPASPTRRAALPQADVVTFCKDHLPENAAAFADPRLELIIDDAKAVLEKEQNGFDVIIMDLDDPLEGGPCYQLYTTEFYEMLRSKLNPGGACDAAAGAPSNLPSEPLLGAFL